MAVVGPSRTGSQNYGIAVLQRFIGDFLHLVPKREYEVGTPPPHLVHAGLFGMVTAGHVFHEMVLSVVVPPVTVPTAELADMRLSVEDPASGRTGQYRDMSVADRAETVPQTVLRPGELVAAAVARVHNRYYRLAQCRQFGSLLMGKGETDQRKAVV